MRIASLVILCAFLLCIPPFALPDALSASFEDKYYKRAGYGGWKYIVIHHSGTASGSAKAFHKYHTDQGWGGLSYHFVIGNGKGMPDGSIEAGFRWEKQISGTHCTIHSWDCNIFGIGICLVGNFEKDKPTNKQLNSLNRLVTRLAKEHNVSLDCIIGHKDVPYDDDPEKHEATKCPGRHFTIDAFRKTLRLQ